MKKSRIVIISIVILGILICYIGFRLSTRKGIVDYLGRKLRGDYETTIEVTKSNDDAMGNLTFSLSGKCYVWNSLSNAYCEGESNEPFIYLEQRPDKIISNGTYIYVQICEVIYQYDKNGQLVRKVEDKGELIFAGKASIYTVSSKDQAVYILAAEDISLAGETANGISEIYQTANIELVAETSECYLGIPIEELETKIETTEEYVRVVTQGYYEVPKYIISKETGAEQTGAYLECMILRDKVMYTGEDWNPNSVFKESMDGKCTQITSGDEKADTTYSGFSLSSNYLIVLGEKYLMQGIGNGRDTSSGTVGDYDKASLHYIDLESGERVKKCELKNEQVIYADSIQYVTLEKGVVKFYSWEDDTLIRTEEITEYQTKHDYQIEICGGKIFVFCDEMFMECLEI